jgi:hypothetical protein
MVRIRVAHQNFDYFAGLPRFSGEADSTKFMPAFDEGNFSSAPRVRVLETIQAATHRLDPSLVALVKCFYNECVLRFDKKQLQDKGPCLIAHTDCDLYLASKDVFTFLDEIAITGTWLLLDDCR